MTDIVDRLRFWPTRPAIMGEIRRDIVDAADEIVRLRKANAEPREALEACLEWCMLSWTSDDPRAAKARAALARKP